MFDDDPSPGPPGDWICAFGMQQMAQRVHLCAHSLAVTQQELEDAGQDAKTVSECLPLARTGQIENCKAPGEHLTGYLSMCG
jgi:hypothetical protein